MAGAFFMNSSGIDGLSSPNETTEEANFAFEHYRLGICVVTVILNVILLTLLLYEKFTQSTFMIYLKFLTGANSILVSVIQPILSLWTVYQEQVLFRSTGCAVVWYWDEVVGGMVLGFHALITINRLWAFLFPLSYHNSHNKKIALISCCLVIFYANILFVPGFCVGFFVLPAHAHCAALIDVSVDLYMTVTLMTKTFPTALVVVGYFVIFAKICLRKTIKHERKISQSGDAPRDHAGHLDHTKHHHHELTIRSSSFAILTASSISVAVAWVPYTVDLCLTGDDKAAAGVFSRVLVQFQPLLDPLLLFILMKELRTALYSRIIFWKEPE